MFYNTVDDIQDESITVDSLAVLDSIYKIWKTAADVNCLDFSNITLINLTPPKFHPIFCTFILYKFFAISLYSSNNSSLT